MSKSLLDQVMWAAFFDELARLLQHKPLRVIAHTSTGRNTLFTDGLRILGLPRVRSGIRSAEFGGYHLLKGSIPRSNPNSLKADNLG